MRPVILNILAAAGVCIAAWTFPSQARAELSTGDRLFSDEATIEIIQIQSCAVGYLNGFNYQYSAFAKLSCSTKQGLEGFLSVTKITTSMIGLGAACTPVGAPVVVAAGITGLASEMIGLIVSNLDCEDPADIQKVDDLVKDRVCSALKQKGIDCSSDQL